MELVGGIFIVFLLFIPSEALEAPCANGGTAVGPGCVCPPGHSGHRCETPDPGSACQNGGTAVGTACFCPPGFGGPRCQQPDPGSACRNGATAFGTRCVCPPGFRGAACQDAEEPGSCLNGGTLENGTCRCPPTAWGPRCECRATGAGRALYVNDTDGAVTATTAGGDNGDEPPVRRERNGTVGPAEGGGDTVGGVTRATTVMGGNGTGVGRSHTVTSTERDTTVDTGTDHDMIVSTDNGVMSITTTAKANMDHEMAGTDHDMIVSTDNGVMSITTTTKANMDHDVMAGTDHDMLANTDHDMVVTTDNGVMSITTTTKANMDHDVMAGTDHDMIISTDNGVMSITTTAKANTIDDVITTTKRDTVHRRSITRATTPEGSTTTALPARRVRNVTASPVGSHPSATTSMEGETTAMEGDTTVTPWNLGEGETTAMEDETTAMEGDTEATPVEGDTEATPVEGDTEATPVEGDTEATPVTTMVSSTRTTTVESDTVTMPPGHPGSHRRVTTTRTRNTTAMENSTRATTPESDTTAVPVTIVGGHSRAMENNTRATIPESDTRATIPESDTTATTPESHTPSTLPSAPANVTSMPVQPNATHTVPDATETMAVTSQAPPNATKATGALGHGSARTTRDILTSTATPTVTTVATICLYLPHGSSPPAIVCHNGGVANRTHCLCPPGYSGPTCETPDPNDRCADGSTAVGDRCICPPGRAGPRCATPDPATACRHGGTAVGTECYCPPGFSGRRCEDPRPTTAHPAKPSHGGRETPRSTRRTTTTTVPTTRDPCLNGGRWMGVGCLCPPNTDGPRCEFGATTINLTAELGPFVTMMARVTNRDFSEDMGDTSSPGHRRFAEEFSRTMDGIYRNVPDYGGICVLSLSRGSVVVNYRVRLRPVPGNASLEQRALELLEVANAAPQPRNCTPSAPGLCFTATSARATGGAAPGLNYTELCRRHAPANFSRFYFPYLTANGVLCVTNCTPNVPGSFDCHGGFCKVTLEGPKCFCPDLPWYLTTGDRCQTHISKLGLGLGVGLGLGLTILILLILCIVLAVRLARGRKKSPGASPFSPGRLHSEDTWPDGGRNSRVTGIYHVNGRGGGKGPYGHNTYKPSSEVADPPAPVLAEGAAAL